MFKDIQENYQEFKEKGIVSEMSALRESMMDRQMRSKGDESVHFDKFLKEKEEENLRLYQELDRIKREQESDKRSRERSMSPGLTTKDAKIQQLELKFQEKIVN